MKLPGKTDSSNSEFELNYWENYGGVEKFDLHLPIYRKVFPFNDLDYVNEKILDVGSGAVSIFEKIAPESARVLPYDILADDYNRIAHDKKFKIQNRVSEKDTFSLITMFNMIDHVDDPEDLLIFISKHLEQCGRVWITTHLDQPHGPEGHPQNFSYRSIVALLTQYFSVKHCGIIQEGIPVPYMWYGILQPLDNSGQSPFLCVYRTACTYYRLHFLRAIFKALKLIGLRRFLPDKWQF